MNNKRQWAPPGWPWELELLALVFVITAIAVPFYLQYVQTPEPSQMSLLAKAEMARHQGAATWQDLQGFFWAAVILGLYLAHLAVAAASFDFISTPFTHLLSPLVFSMITYYRLFQLSRTGAGAANIVNGSLLELALWIAGVLVITFLVARIRMARHMLNFRNIDWDITTPPLFDGSYFELVFQIRPLIYPPRMFRACPQGILVEGWFYVMPIPFTSIQAVDPVQGTAFISSGYCLATTTSSLLRVQITERTEPILISPRDRESFLHYCHQRLAVTKPRTKAGETASGARQGIPEDRP